MQRCFFALVFLNIFTQAEVLAAFELYQADVGRYKWRHHSVLNVLATSLKAINDSSLYVEVPDLLSPVIINGYQFRSDLLLIAKDHILYVLELTVGFETNLEINAKSKHEKYATLIADRKKRFK